MDPVTAFLLWVATYPMEWAAKLLGIVGWAS